MAFLAVRLVGLTAKGVNNHLDEKELERKKIALLVEKILELTYDLKPELAGDLAPRIICRLKFDFDRVMFKSFTMKNVSKEWDNPNSDIGASARGLVTEYLAALAVKRAEAALAGIEYGVEVRRTDISKGKVAYKFPIGRTGRVVSEFGVSDDYSDVQDKWVLSVEIFTPTTQSLKIVAVDLREIEVAKYPAGGGFAALTYGATRPEEATCQLQGKGDFIPVQLELEPSGTFSIKDHPSGVLKDSIKVNVFTFREETGQATIRHPKSARKGHPHCFRVEIGKKKDRKKFIISLASKEDLHEWMICLYGGASSEQAAALDVRTYGYLDVCTIFGQLSAAAECGYDCGVVAGDRTPAQPASRAAKHLTNAPAAEVGLTCHDCGIPWIEGNTFCHGCGAAAKAADDAPSASLVQDVGLTCHDCGIPWVEGTKFCHGCGAKAADAAPSAPPAQAPADTAQAVTAQTDEEVCASFLSTVPLFQSFSKPEIAEVCACISEQKHGEGAYVIRQGEVGDLFYIVQSGQAHATIPAKDGGELVVKHYQAGDFFGELALLGSADGKRAANVIATSQLLCCLCISRSDFKRVLGSVEEYLHKQAAVDGTKSHTTPEIQSLEQFLTEARLEDFLPKFKDLGATDLQDLFGHSVEDLQQVGMKKMEAKRCCRLLMQHPDAPLAAPAAEPTELEPAAEVGDEPEVEEEPAPENQPDEAISKEADLRAELSELKLGVEDNCDTIHPLTPALRNAP